MNSFDVGKRRRLRNEVSRNAIIPVARSGGKNFPDRFHGNDLRSSLASTVKRSVGGSDKRKSLICDARRKNLTPLLQPLKN